MALRYLVTRTAANGFRTANKSPRTYTTATAPWMKSYAPAADFSRFDHHHRQQQSKPKASRAGDFVPVYVAIGMIALSVGLGLHTAKQQLAHSPSVSVRKKRRETIPEVVEPEHVAEETEKFFAKSFFRKVAHVQEVEKFGDYKVPYDPLLGDAYAHGHRTETLKSVGIDPASN
ncbi:uncharacterized protein LOC120069725 [Benincasa hispida]|uniref:uncharacterized protein LOC120069725 n=1 Tax=Benincasa hispida TaxID=102211 RepID=UPI0018FFB198|nr:uncharacterized protein LOC120069725 [Benincasa hispida]